MAGRGAASDRTFDALHTLLATARELARELSEDPQIERLVRAFRALPQAERETIVQVVEKDAAWRKIVEQTDGTTGISVRPNPHASLYVHVLNQVEQSERDADVIRHGVETLVKMLPFLFQEAVHAQWTAAARDLARTSSPDLRDLAARLAREVLSLLGEAPSDAAPPRR
jgi:hypothetical protein